MSRCFECDDYVEEYGQPVCLGCYQKAKRRISDLEKSVARLTGLISAMSPYIHEKDFPRIAMLVDKQGGDS